jgi:hypothetical protein
MVVVRNCFVAKLGAASKPAAKFKAAAIMLIESAQKEKP